MSERGSVTIELSATTDKLTKAVAEGTRSVEGFGNRFKSSIEAATSSSKSHLSGFGSHLKTIVDYAAGQVLYKLAGSVYDYGKQFMGAAGIQRKAEGELKSALSATGQEVDANHGKLLEMAKNFEKVTTYSDDSILSIMTLGTNMGITAGQMDSFVKATIGVSKATGKELKEGAMIASKAIAGNFESLQEVIPALKNVQNETQRAAMVQKFLAGGFKQAEDAAQTSGGRTTAVWNRVNDIFESLGGPITKIKGYMAGALESIVPLIENLAPSMSSFMDTGINGLLTMATALEGPVIAAVKLLWEGLKLVGSGAAWLWPYLKTGLQEVAGVFAATFELIKNWDNVWDYLKKVFDSWVLYLYQGVEDFFLKDMPYYWDEFNATMTAVFLGLYNGVTTLFKNLGSNFSNLVDIIRGKKTWEGVWSGFTFDKEEVKKPPDRDRTLQNQLDEEAASAGQTLIDLVAGARKNVEDTFNGKSIASQMAEASGADKLKKAQEETAKAFGDKGIALGKEVRPGQTGESKGSFGGTEGLADAYKRIQEAMFKNNDEKALQMQAAQSQAATAANTERTAGTMDKMLVAIERGFDRKNVAVFAASVTA